MSMIKVGVHGASGRMGQEVIETMSEFPGLEVVQKIDTQPSNESLARVDAKMIDIVIDFSSPQGLCDIVLWCAKNNIPLVSGTTGLQTEHKQLIKKESTKIPILWAPNMSIGICVMNQMLRVLSQLSDYDYHIEEIHHNQKKDKPSGTALLIQEHLEKALNKKINEPTSIRGGGVFGQHKVFSFGKEESITIEHTAFNRKIFARGAIQSGQWLVFQKPGLYILEDMLRDK